MLAYDFDRAAEAGAPLITLDFTPEQEDLKLSAYNWYGRALTQGLKLEELKPFSARVEDEFPQSNLAFRLRVSLESMTGTDGREFAKLQEDINRAKRNNQQEQYETALMLMYYFHIHRRHHDHFKLLKLVKSDRKAAQELADVSKYHITAAFDLYRQILQEARGRETKGWGNFARGTIANFATGSYLTTRGPVYNRPLIVSPGQRVHYLNSALKTFGWHGEAAYRAHEELAKTYRYWKHWDELVEEWQYLFENSHDAHMYGLPESWDDYTHRGGTPSFIDKQIDVLMKIAATQKRELKNPQAAAENFRRVLEEFGTNHKHAVSAANELEKLDESWQVPQKAALIWGGRGTVNSMWRGLLEPMGYTVHSVLQYKHGAPHLAPYQLVVLAHPIDAPYEPRDIFALRSHVATGGSLLCVVSPGWHPAATGVHNSLLHFFGVKADHEMKVRAHSTQIVPHPITEGIEKAMAKCAVNLQVPEGSALIHSNDRVVLAAMPYRAGRVVVASFGQWFYPHVRAILLPLSRRAQPLRSVPRLQRPLESGKGLQHDLLKNVLAWLSEPAENDAELAELRKRFTAARQVSFRNILGLATDKDLEASMDQLVADTKPAIWREEALWTAGEAFLQSFFEEGRRGPVRLRAGELMKHFEDDSRDPQPAYFQRLVAEFPDSPLRPFAQWRLAECQRRLQMTSRRPRRDGDAAAKLYEGIDAPPGSYAWAWAEFRMGQARFQNGDVEGALEHFDALAEEMDVGPEKLFGVFSAGACHELMKNKDESVRYFRLIAGFPDLAPRVERHSQWGPVRAKGSVVISLHRVARAELGESQYQRYVKKFGEPEQ